MATSKTHLNMAMTLVRRTKPGFPISSTGRVMVHRYPANVKAFYMEPDPVDPKFALCVDVLAPEGYGEIIGGSQRVDKLRPAEEPH